jgi:hypothetical protein
MLADYGDYHENVSVFRCVRKIPKKFVDPISPLAFILRVAGKARLS